MIAINTAVMLLTVGITVLTHNLAIGLLSGVALAAILFSRKVAKVIDLNRESTDLFARIGVAQEAGGRGGELGSAH